jgi:hypothetical protein
LKDIILIYPELNNIVQDYFISNKQFIIDSLFSSDENMNLAFKNFLYNTINVGASSYKDEIAAYLNADSIIEKPKTVVLLDLLLEFIPQDVSKSWLKMVYYLELWESIAIQADQLLMTYIFKRELISKLIDFFLMKDSPLYKKGESRTEFGSRNVPPKFAPLINTVSHMLRYSKENSIQLTENDKELLMCRHFYKKAIKDSFNNQALSKILACLMYNNFEFSKKRIFMLLEVVNDGISLSDAKNAFELLFNVVSIEDNYTDLRLEWIFGVPQLVVKSSETIPSLPVRGAKYGDKVYKYLSPLLYGTYHDSLIERVISKYQASSDFITILNYFFSLVFYKPHTFNYFDSLPHPRKDKAYLYEYVFTLAEEELHRIYNVTSMQSKYESSIKGTHNIMANYANQREEFRKQHDGSIYKFRPKYSYGKIIKEHITHYEDNSINSSNVFCFSVEYDVEILETAPDSDDNFNKTKDDDMVIHKPEIIGDIETGAVTDSKYDSDRSVNSVPADDEGDVHNTSGLAVKGEDEKKDISINDIEETKEQVIEKHISQQKAVVEHDISSLYNEPGIFANNEDIFYKRNLGLLLEKEYSARTYHEFKNLTVNCIKRYLIFNNSDKEYKIRFNFMSNDDFTNCYMPRSEVVIIAKKNCVTNAFTFVKDDINLPWNEIVFTLESEPYESKENNNEERFEEKAFKQSKSLDNLIGPLPLPAAEDVVNVSEEDCFPAGKYVFNFRLY